jgi:hypothetical protein
MRVVLSRDEIAGFCDRDRCKTEQPREADAVTGILPALAWFAAPEQYWRA